MTNLHESMGPGRDPTRNPWICRQTRICSQTRYKLRYATWCSMVFYLSNRLTNTFMFGVILNRYLSYMLLLKFHEDAKMQTRQVLLWIHILFVNWKKQNFNGKGNFLFFEKCAQHLHYLMKLDNFVPFGRPSSGKVIIQVMTEFVVSGN